MIQIDLPKDVIEAVNELDDIAEFEQLMELAYHRLLITGRAEGRNPADADGKERRDLAHRLRCVLDRSPRVGVPRENWGRWRDEDRADEDRAAERRERPR